MSNSQNTSTTAPGTPVHNTVSTTSVQMSSFSQLSVTDATIVSVTTPIPVTPSPTVPPRKKRRAPLPPGVTSPTTPTSIAPPNVPPSSLPICIHNVVVQTPSTPSAPLPLNVPQTMIPITPSTVPTAPLLTTIVANLIATPSTSTVVIAPPPTTPHLALPTAPIANPPTTSETSTVSIVPAPAIPLAIPHTTIPPSTVPIVPVQIVLPTVPISTKSTVAPPTPSQSTVTSYLSLASVALGKIPNVPLPVVPTPSPCIPSQPVLASRFQRRENLAGFEDMNWYKIRNVGDNSVVHLDQGNKFICMQESVEHEDLQLFRAIQQPNGAYRIMAKMQKSAESIQVWDYLPQRGLLLQKKQSKKTDKFQQNWKSEGVPGFNSLYLIQSGPAPESQLCLKNTGLGEQITLVTKNEEAASDNFAHWYLEELQD